MLHRQQIWFLERLSPKRLQRTRHLLSVKSRLGYQTHNRTQLFEILQTEIEAFNRGDVEGSVSWFTPDAVLVTALGGCTPCIGQLAIRDHWSRAVSAQTKIGVATARTEGDVVRASSWLRAPSLPDGVERAVGTVIVTVRDGRIARWDQEYDLNDPQTARLFAAVALTTSSPTSRP